VENAGETGRFMLGDTTQATIQIKWWSLSDVGFDYSHWIDERRRSMWADATEDSDAPGSDCFDRTLWLPKAQTRKGASSSAWYGYDERARLIIEVVINDAAGREVLDLARNLVLPSMEVSDPNAPIRWSVYGTRFESPTGYDIYDSRLNLGAISLFLRKGKDRLLLCQFYPATVALANQPLTDWLEISALQGKWHAKEEPKIGNCRVGESEGIRQERGMYRPFPLDRLGKSHCLSMIVHDKRLDRLLMAEHIHLMQADEALLVDCIEKMNWEQ